jgi:hypothetical protein
MNEPKFWSADGAAADMPHRYVSRSQGGGVARFEVVESEAHIVRRIFAWVGLDRLSLRAVCRRLQQMGCRTRQGSTYWHASTIRGMLDNPAYIGRAAFGRARFLPPRPRLRPIRGHLKPSPRATSCVPMPREEWIEIPVPSIVDPAVFEATRVQLEESRKRKRERARGQCWLLQGLTVFTQIRSDERLALLSLHRCGRLSVQWQGRGIGRLIDSYTEGVIDKTEFEPRIVGLRQRLSQLQERHQAALEAAETERDLALVISRLEDFSAKVSKASTISIELACRTSSESSYAGSKSTTAASRLSSGSHHQIVHRDQDHQPKQPILNNIVQALTVHRLGST